MNRPTKDKSIEAEPQLPAQFPRSQSDPDACDKEKPHHDQRDRIPTVPDDYRARIQSTGIAACVKHFALNNKELARRTGNVEVDERTLHEIYLAGFDNAYFKGKPILETVTPTVALEMPCPPLLATHASAEWWAEFTAPRSGTYRFSLYANEWTGLKVSSRWVCMTAGSIDAPTLIEGIEDLIIANGTDASETLCPMSIGGNQEPWDMRRKVGHRIALIGGMDQHSVLTDGTPEQTRAQVHKLFDTVGQGGGYILSCADHFFETPPANLAIYANAARECVY